MSVVAIFNVMCQKYDHYASNCRNKKKIEEANFVQTHEEEPALLESVSEVKGCDMIMLEENVHPNC